MRSWLKDWIVDWAMRGEWCGWRFKVSRLVFIIFRLKKV
jgi:hypothetical protein